MEGTFAIPYQKFVFPPRFYYSLYEIKLSTLLQWHPVAQCFTRRVVKGDHSRKNVECVCTCARLRSWRSLTRDFVLKKEQLNELRGKGFLHNLPKRRT